MTRSDVVFLTFGVAAGAAVLSYVFSFISETLARRFLALDQPTGGRKIHTKPMPLWGGLGIAITILIMLGVGKWVGWFEGDLRTAQLAGFACGILVLLLGGMIDDRHPLSPQVQIIFPMLASLAVIISGTGIVQVTHPGGGGLSLVWWRFGNLSLPADIITFLWLLVATYATKILDGLDGLVSGLACIGAGLVGALSLSIAFFQPSIALLSAVIGGSFLGFLPKNAYPAKQFLGESGGLIAGFSMGVLAILSGAKIAIALAVLAIPITDVALVMFGRIRRGAPWYRGDATHLHFRLLKAGLSQRAAVFLVWGVSLFAGLIALSLQTRGKLFLIGTLIVLTAITSWFAGTRMRSS